MYLWPTLFLTHNSMRTHYRQPYIHTVFCFLLIFSVGWLFFVSKSLGRGKGATFFYISEGGISILSQHNLERRPKQDEYIVRTKNTLHIPICWWSWPIISVSFVPFTNQQSSRKQRKLILLITPYINIQLSKYAWMSRWCPFFKWLHISGDIITPVYCLQVILEDNNICATMLQL